MRDDLRSVNAFLAFVRECLVRGLWVLAVQRPENSVFLRDHGLRIEDVPGILETLSSGDREKGPMDDDEMGRPAGTVFSFLKHFEDEDRITLVYIKIKVPDLKQQCIVVSLHESETVWR